MDPCSVVRSLPASPTQISGLAAMAWPVHRPSLMRREQPALLIMDDPHALAQLLLEDEITKGEITIHDKETPT